MPPFHMHIPSPATRKELWLPSEVRAAGAPEVNRLSGSGSGYVPEPERWDVDEDPTAAVPGAPPNWGEYALPHVSSFAGVVTTASKTYRASDEALRHSHDNARFMRNDPVIMEPLELRQKATAMLDWHVEPEDDSDPEAKELAKQVQQIIEATPRWMQYRECLLHATWYGRYAVENRWAWKQVRGKMRCTIADWLPVHGDKLVFRYDDGSGDHRAGQVGIRVGANAFSSSRRGTMGRDLSKRIESTDRGLAYFFDSYERPLLSVHKYMIEDGEWEDPASAGRIHGNGIRSRIYWAWYQKQEALAMMLEYLERSAAGVEIWYYPMGNATAEAQVKKAAQERMSNGRNQITVPRPVGADSAYYDVQRIEPSMAGVAELKEVIHNYFGHQIKRYIVGQTLTTEPESTGLGSSLADVQLETFMLLIRYDSQLLEETLTTEIVSNIQRFNFPGTLGTRLVAKIDTESPEAEKKMEAFQRAFQMGLELRGEDIRDLIGASKPTDDDEVVSMAAMQAAMQSRGGEPPAVAENSGGESGSFGSPEGQSVGNLTANAEPVGPESVGYAATDSTEDRSLVVPSDGARGN